MAEAETRPKVRVEATVESPVLRRLEVVVEAESVRRAWDRAYRDLARQVRVRGFRPGKAPRSVLESLYGASMAEQLEHALVSDTLEQALEQAGLEPVAEPTIEAGPPVAGAPFRYTARVEVRPPIELPDLSGLRGRRPRVEVSEADVGRELEALQQRQALLLEEPEGTPAARGHVLTVDFAGRVDGKPFEGGSGRDVEVELGAGHFLPGFEDGLEGARAGEDRELRLRLPEDHPSPALAGREAVFAVHVHAVRRRELPALDDELAKDLGEDFESLGDLRARIRQDLTRLRERAARAELQRSLLESLVSQTRFDVPAGLVERQLQQQLHSARHRLEGSLPEATLEGQLARWKEEWRGRAEQSVRERLLIGEVARSRGIAPTPDQVEAHVREMAEQQGVEPGALRKAYGRESLERLARSELVDQLVLEFLASQAKVEETSDS
jgi:trigger factor